MRMPFNASRRVAAPLILATATLSLLALHCSSDGVGEPIGTAGASTQPTSGSGGTASQGGSSAGMAAGGVSTAGSASGGTGTAGTVATAGAAGLGGGASGGSGGGSGGANGGSGGGASGGSGGGSGATFAQVKDLLAMSCKGAKCHDAGTMHMDWITSDGLYLRLTSAITKDHCIGDKPVVAGMADQSLLVRALKGSTMCSKAGGGMESIGRMPDNCGKAANPPCLSDTQIKLVSDWIAAGAPM
jgi:hypothetical protein